MTYFRILDPGFRASALTALALGTLLASAGAQQARISSAIPDRPEKLIYPPLVYEPPSPEHYRVALKSGPYASSSHTREPRFASRGPQRSCNHARRHREVG